MSNTAIITGGSGFIGSNLARFLVNKGWDIHLILRESSILNQINDIIDKISIFYYNQNIEDLITYFKKTDANVVYHLASCIKTEHRPSDIAALFDCNLKFSTEIIEATSQAKIKYFINTGTYWQHYYSNDYNPVDLYAATKEAFEKIINYYVEAESIKAMTLKLYDTYGENDIRPKLINLLHQFADDGKELDMSAGEQKIYLTHISDVCNAYFQAYYNLQKYEKSISSYAVRGKQNYSLKELIQVFEETSGKKIKINWGNRPYRKREVMLPNDKILLVENWETKIDLREGLLKYENSTNTFR